MRKRRIVISLFSVTMVLLFSVYGFCTDYEYSVPKVKFQYTTGEVYERELSDVNIILRDDSSTLPVVELGIITDLPEGIIDLIDLYLYREEGDLWDKDGWLGWNFLNGQTMAISKDSVKDITIRLQWNGMSYDVVEPVVEL